MSLTRIHNFSISLDGFGTGEPQSADAPFGHAGERLHEWMFRTRFWHPSGTAGVDDAFAQVTAAMAVSGQRVAISGTIRRYTRAVLTLGGAAISIVAAVQLNRAP